MTFALSLGPHERWDLTVDVLPWLEGDLATVEQLDDERETVGDVVAAWTLRVPRVRGGWESLRRAFDRSIADLAALRMRTGEYRRPLFAAGMPWFMTVFGRDTAITSLQTLLLGPEIAMGALDALTELQAREEDPTIDAEPGKIVHEVREGRCAEFWFPRYYGSVDSTPLYLVLLAETWRWTDDATLVRRLREPAMRALEWVDRYGDRDGDGFVEYSRQVDSGLANQSWKDSGDSQRFQDGSFAEAPIAAVEVQGYVYDAKRGLAEVAREVWREQELADRLEREAEELRARFDEAFWVTERGGFYALALDGKKRQVDSRSSNMGHLLWSGIVPPERVPKVVDQLLSEELWSGWGIRTMASDAEAFNPISYHNGTVWPHDTALAARGLARHGYTAEARRVGRALIEAAGHFDWSLPEVFAGYARDETPFPIAYPTAARPQAWAAGTPILLVRVLLGIEPDRERQRLVSTVTDELPSWLDGLRIEGVRAYGRTWTAAVERGRVTIAEGV
jgi:glycogen debranching enzyme